MGDLHPLVIGVAAVQQLGRLVHPDALRLQVVLWGVQPEGTALTLVSLRHATLRGERAQDAWPEQRRPDDAEPVLLHAACLSVELPAVVLLQVGDEGIREVGSTRHACVERIAVHLAVLQPQTTSLPSILSRPWRASRGRDRATCKPGGRQGLAGAGRRRRALSACTSCIFDQIGQIAKPAGHAQGVQFGA